MFYNKNSNENWEVGKKSEVQYDSSDNFAKVIEISYYRILEGIENSHINTEMTEKELSIDVLPFLQCIMIDQ